MTRIDEAFFAQDCEFSLPEPAPEREPEREPEQAEERTG